MTARRKRSDRGVILVHTGDLRAFSTHNYLLFLMCLYIAVLIQCEPLFDLIQSKLSRNTSIWNKALRTDSMSRVF